MKRQVAQKVKQQVVHVRKPINVQGYARIPHTVLYDHELSPEAKCVYGFLATAVWQGRTAAVGQRLIADRVGLRQQTVGKALKELKQRGHIDVRGEGKARRLYVLHSPVFAQKQGKADVIVSGPSGVLRLASVARSA